MRKLMPKCLGANGWCGSFPYLVLWEHFVHFLPSHVSNAPQPSQISIAALILTIISGRDRCRHFISRSPRSASLSLSLAPFLSLSLSRTVHTLWSSLCVIHKHTVCSFTRTCAHTFQSALLQGVARCDECLVN